MKKASWRMACLLLVLICCFSLCACAANPTQDKASSQQSSLQKLEGNGFSSPEAAITAFAEALQKGSVDEMIATYAIESYVEHFDFENYLRKYPAIYFNTDVAINTQNSNRFAYEVSKYTQLAVISLEIRRAYCNLLGLDTNNSYKLYDEQTLADMVELVSAPDFHQKLSEMKIGDVLTKDDFTFLYAKEGYEQSLDDMLSYLDASELCDLVLEINFAGEEYYLFMRTAKIDGKWYNITTASLLVFYVIENEDVYSTVFHKR